MEQLKRFGVPLIVITGAVDSFLARQADVVLDASVTDEACPTTDAPTTSTTVALALGDALAVALLSAKGFRREDFARLHPGGSLGRKLVTRVRDLMVGEDVPCFRSTAEMREAVVLLAKRRGTVAIVDDAERVLGVITAGDLTRLMERGDDFLSGAGVAGDERDAQDRARRTSSRARARIAWSSTASWRCPSSTSATGSWG